jgi:hypothetical protein
MKDTRPSTARIVFCGIALSPVTRGKGFRPFSGRKPEPGFSGKGLSLDFQRKMPVGNNNAQSIIFFPLSSFEIVDYNIPKKSRSL